MSLFKRKKNEESAESITEDEKKPKAAKPDQTVYIVRHGQTQFNIEGKVQGWKDSSLTAQGLQQIMEVKDWFDAQDIHFKHIYTSDLGRAVQTARILMDPESTVYAAQGLREISFGDLDGQDGSCFEGVDWDQDYEKHGGESYGDMILRAFQTMHGILMQDTEDPLLIVTHGATLNGLYQVFAKSKDKEWEDFPDMHNGQVVKCRYIRANPEAGISQPSFVIEDMWHPGQ